MTKKVVFKRTSSGFRVFGLPPPAGKRKPFVPVSIPSSKYQVKLERVKPTWYVRDSQGLMRGRRNSTPKFTDKLYVRRLTSPVDVNKDGDTKDKIDLQKGEVIGRSSSPGKPSGLVIRRHWSGGKIVKTHRRFR